MRTRGTILRRVRRFRGVQVAGLAAVLAVGVSVGVPSTLLGTADSTPPDLVFAGELVDRPITLDHLGLLFNDRLDPTSIPDPGDFSFYVLPDAPTPTPLPPINTPTGLTLLYAGFSSTAGLFSPDGLTLIRLDLGVAFAPTDHVYLTYTPGARPFRDLAGNPAAGFTNLAPDLVTGDLGITVGFIDDGTGPNHLLVVASQPFDPTLPTADDFTVRINDGAPIAASSIKPRLQGLGIGVLDLTLPVAVSSTDTVTWSYTPTAPALTFLAGPAVPAILDATVDVSLPSTPSRETPTGTDVTVAPPDATTGTSPVTIDFATVTSSGTTSIESSETGPAAPAGFSFGDPATYYELTTTATFTSAQVCFNYDPAAFNPPESALQLLHYEGGSWVDTTAPGYPDTVNHRICGDVTSFSPFAIGGRPAIEFSGFFAPVDNPPVVNTVKAGSAVPVEFGLGGDLGLSIFGSGSPSSQSVACSSGDPVDAIEQTVSPGAVTLTFDATTGRYTYVWKTLKGWTGCRRLILTFFDGTTRSATFNFR